MTTGLLEIETAANPSIPQVVTSGLSSRIRKGTEENFLWLTYQTNEFSGRYGWTDREMDALELKSSDEVALNACLDFARTVDLPLL